MPMTKAWRPRRPDFILKVKAPNRDKWTWAGAAWLLDPGDPESGVRVQLDPGVVLSWNDGLAICLFPKEER